jgi:glycosyltransferase involved in cell wall biosynthesis
MWHSHFLLATPGTENSVITGQDIVCIAEMDYDSTVWPICRHLMSRLAKAGNRVLYVESLGLRVPSLLHAADIRKIARRLRGLVSGRREPEPNLWVIAPRALPGHHIVWIRWINRCLLKAQIRSTMQKLKMQDPLLWIFLPTGVPLVGELGEKLVIYYCMDEYLANPGVPVEALKVMEDRLVSEADAVLVTAPKLLEKFKPTAKRLAWIPCGVDIDAYQAGIDQSEPAEMKSIPHPRIGFAGNLTGYKVDYALLDSLIRSRPQWSFVFMGTMGAGDPSNQIPAFLSYPNVHRLGEKPFEKIPAFLQSWDAGIIPYRHSATTDAVFPLKLFEYLAAGLPVVSTPLPSLNQYREFCFLASDVASFQSALDRAVKNPGQDAVQRKAYAGKNSWESRLEQISDFLTPTLTGSPSITGKA